MEQATRQEIMQAVSTAIQQTLGRYEEKWLSPREVCEQFQFLTPSWLKTYGHLLPRVQATVTDEQGVAHRTGWAYPRNRLQEMAEKGALDFAMSDRCQYRPSRG